MQHTNTLLDPYVSACPWWHPRVRELQGQGSSDFQRGPGPSLFAQPPPDIG